jgi:hypothetical protein
MHDLGMSDIGKRLEISYSAAASDARRLA